MSATPDFVVVVVVVSNYKREGVDIVCINLEHFEDMSYTAATIAFKSEYNDSKNFYHVLLCVIKMCK